MVVVGLGANLGDRRATIVEAARRVRELPFVGAARLSSLWETVPVGGPPQGLFLNAALLLDADDRVKPAELVVSLLEIERALGRVRSGVRDAPRTVDLDVLWTDGPPSADPSATIPHPRLHLRPFALAPLVELVPDARDPFGTRYADHLARADGAGIRCLAPPPEQSELDRKNESA